MSCRPASPLLRLKNEQQAANVTQAQAGSFLAGLPAAAVDFLFLDAERHEYPGYWPDLRRVLAPNGLIVVDNAVSHAPELAPFAAAVTGTPGYQTALLPVGKGEWLTLKPV